VFSSAAAASDDEEVGGDEVRGSGAGVAVRAAVVFGMARARRRGAGPLPHQSLCVRGLSRSRRFLLNGLRRRRRRRRVRLVARRPRTAAVDTLQYRRRRRRRARLRAAVSSSERGFPRADGLNLDENLNRLESVVVVVSLVIHPAPTLLDQSHRELQALQQAPQRLHLDHRLRHRGTPACTLVGTISLRKHVT